MEYFSRCRRRTRMLSRHRASDSDSIPLPMWQPLLVLHSLPVNLHAGAPSRFKLLAALGTGAPRVTHLGPACPGPQRIARQASLRPGRRYLGLLVAGVGGSPSCLVILRVSDFGRVIHLIPDLFAYLNIRPWCPWPRPARGSTVAEAPSRDSRKARSVGQRPGATTLLAY